MISDALISICTIQNCDDAADADTIEFVTDGAYDFTDNTGCAMYQESEITGMPGTHTSVSVSPEEIIVDRYGTLTSRMVFREGEKTEFLFSTPFGQATLGINTRRIKQRFGENGGNAEIEYVIDVEHTVFTKNKFTINVERSGGIINA